MSQVVGDKGRRRKIFVGCPAIRPIWDQSPGIRNPRLETVGNRLYPLHDQDCLRRFTAEAQIQDRSRKSTGLNTAPGFLRAKCPFREAQTPDDGARKRSDRGGCPRTPPSSPRRREPREKQSTPFTPFAKAGTQGKTKHAANPTHTPAPFPKRRGPKRPIQAQRPRGMPPVIPAQAGTQGRVKGDKSLFARPRRACPGAIREIRGSGKTPPKHNRDA